MDETPRVTPEAVRRRDPQAIAALVRPHHRALRGYVAALSADLAAVDDLTQEVFVRALERLDRVDALEDFAAFLRGIARNVVREHSRRRARRAARYEQFVEEALAGTEPPPGDPGLSQALRRCVDALPSRSRRLLDLRYVEERRAEDIGREMGMAAGAVRVVLLRIRDALLKCLRSRRGVSPQGAGG